MKTIKFTREISLKGEHVSSKTPEFLQFFTERFSPGQHLTIDRLEISDDGSCFLISLDPPDNEYDLCEFTEYFDVPGDCFEIIS